MNKTRRTVYLIIAILLFCGSLYLFLENIFLPNSFKRFVILRAQEFLNRPVSLGEIHFSPWRGFIIRDLTVYQKDDPDKPFLRVEEASFNIFFAPPFNQKIVIIPSIEFKRPFVHIIREEKDSWNFSDLWPLQNKPSRKKNLILLSRKVLIRDGEIVYTDKTSEEESLLLIDDIDVDMRLALNKSLRFTFEAQIPRDHSALRAKGTYQIETKKLSSRVSLSNLHPAEHLSLFLTNPGIRWNQGVITDADIDLSFQNRRLTSQGSWAVQGMDLNLDDNLRITADWKASEASIGWADNRWQAAGRLESPIVKITLGPDETMEGGLSAEIKSLKIATPKITVEGSVSVLGLKARMGSDQSLAGNLATQHTEILFENQKLMMRSDLSLNAAQIRWAAPSYLQGEPRPASMRPSAEAGPPLAGRAAGQSLSADIILPKLSVSREDQKISVQTAGTLRNALLELAGGITVKDNPLVEASYTYDPQNEKDLKQHDYTAAVTLSQAALNGIPYVQQISSLAGKILLHPNRLQSDQLAFQTQGADILLSGELNDFAEPSLRIEAHSENIDLKRLFDIFPVLTQTTTIHPNGTIGIQASYKGALKNPLQAQISADAKLKDGSITSEKFPYPITAVSGELNYQKDLVTLTNFLGTYQNKQYSLSGQLTNFSKPVLDLKASSTDLDLTSKINILHNAFQVASLSGQYFHTSFDLKGDVHLSEDSGPDVDLRGNFALDLEDLRYFLPQLTKELNAIEPTGTLVAEGLFQGQFKDWRDWQMALLAHSPTLAFQGYHFDDVQIQYEQRDRHVSKCNLRSRLYNGDLEVVSSVDLMPDDLSMKLIGHLENLDLAQLRKDKFPKNENLAGSLSSLVNLSGPLSHPDQFQGEGALAVTNGHLWRWHILDGLLGVLLIPEFRDVVFTDGQANFTIQDGKVSTNDAWLKGSAVELKGSGWIDFSQNINFDILPVFDETSLLESKSLKKGATVLLTQTGDYFNIKLTGTLKNPKYKVMTSPSKILETTTDILKGGLQEGGGILKEGIETIFKEIF